MNMRTWFIFAFAILACICLTNAQSVQFKVPIALVVGTFPDTLYVGVNGDGPGGSINDNTYGLDESEALFGPLGAWSESSAPPADPDGNRKRFVDIPGHTEIAAGSFLFPYDFRGYSSPTQIDTFAIRIDGARVEASGLTISWPSNLGRYGTSWKLYSRAGSAFTEVADMQTTQSYTFEATGATINFVIIKVGALMTDVKSAPVVPPSSFQLAQNYPNPFNPTTEITFSVASRGRATVRVYNTLGQELLTLFDGVAEPGRSYSKTLDGTGLSSGMYFYRLTSGGKSTIKKMVLLK
jgi:hypothetical protein